MPLPLSRLLGALSATLMIGACAVVQAADTAALPPVEHFFANARFSQPTLSPNGKLLAVITGTPTRRDALHVIDLATSKVYSAAAYSDADIGQFQWVNDKRLIYNTADRTLAQGEVEDGPGLFAVNFDGSGMRQLAQRYWGEVLGGMLARVPLLPPNVSLSDDPGKQDSDSVYVINRVYEGDSLSQRELILVDTLTGRARRMAGPRNTMDWLLDAEGEPRVAFSLKDKDALIYWRPPGTTEWKQLTSTNAYTGGEGSFTPLDITADGTLYVKTRKGDKSALYTFNPATGKLADEPLIETAGYDFNGHVVMNKGVVQGYRFTTDAEGVHWVNPARKAVQEAVDAKLTGTINSVYFPTRPEAPWVLVASYSDKLPRTYLLYNTETKAFNPVGSSYPEIKPEQMGRQEMVSYKSRDGMTIPALLTLPKGQRTNLPLVVLVHGGPYVNGASWGWDSESQFLASRGYAVLEPSFRGTTGLGYAHYRAGWRQWGLGMQDDIDEGARWAIGKGIADGKRVCIAGASYGGYAALMGLIKSPELYKCGINWVGVTDISLLHKRHWFLESDMSDAYRKHGLPELVGDLVKDAEQIKATSPLMQASKIKQPLLLAYGGADKRVPLNHGTEFYNAVKVTNPNVEWVTYPNEGHGFALPENRIDFYKRVERFLERNIGKEAASR